MPMGCDWTDRLKAVGRRIGLTPTSSVDLVQNPSGRWLLTGCMEGDQEMPVLYCRTRTEALEAVEDCWLGRAACQDRPSDGGREHDL